MYKFLRSHAEVTPGQVRSLERQAMSCVAELRMIKWMLKMEIMLKNSGLVLKLSMFYVDDIRFLMSPIREGWR